MRNLTRVLAFDVTAPLLTIAGLIAIGVMLDWPLWWVSVGSMLCLLVAEAVVLNTVGYRRDSVTMGTDDDAPGFRFAAVGVTAATLVSAAAVGYSQWSVPDRAFTRDTDEVARIAVGGVAETAHAQFESDDAVDHLGDAESGYPRAGGVGGASPCAHDEAGVAYRFVEGRSPGGPDRIPVAAQLSGIGAP